MATRLTFDGLAPNCATAVLDGGGVPIPEEGVSITEPRVKFVRGEVTTGTPAEGFVACGPGTEYPLEVTIKQLEEIFYRVRDAWFTAGTLTSSGGLSYSVGNAPTGSNLANEEVAGDAGNFYYRGYCVPETDLYPFDDHYPMDTTGGLDSEKFGEVYDTGSHEFRDMLPQEHFMWQKLIGQSEYWPGCAFNHYVSHENANESSSSIYGFWTEGAIESASELKLRVFPLVAWVGADHPFHPDATMYVRLTFSFNPLDIDTVYSLSETPHTNVVGPRLRIELSGGDAVSCPLYSADGALTGYDFTLTAQKWWPYAHSDGTPVWNESTGALITE